MKISLPMLIGSLLLCMLTNAFAQPPIKSIEAPSILSGMKFESALCRAPAIYELFSAKAYRIRLNFKDHDVERTTTYYSTRDCTGAPAFSFIEKGVYEESDEPGSDETYSIDFHYRTLQAVVHSNLGKHFADREILGLCGIRKWKLNRVVNVTAESARLNCYMTKVPREVHDFFQLEKTMLYFGRGYGDHTFINLEPRKLKRNEPFVPI